MNLTTQQLTQQIAELDRQIADLQHEVTANAGQTLLTYLHERANGADQETAARLARHTTDAPRNAEPGPRDLTAWDVAAAPENLYGLATQVAARQRALLYLDGLVEEIGDMSVDTLSARLADGLDEIEAAEIVLAEDTASTVSSVLGQGHSWITAELREVPGTPDRLNSVLRDLDWDIESHHAMLNRRNSMAIDRFQSYVDAGVDPEEAQQRAAEEIAAERTWSPLLSRPDGRPAFVTSGAVVAGTPGMCGLLADLGVRQRTVAKLGRERTQSVAPVLASYRSAVAAAALDPDGRVDGKTPAEAAVAVSEALNRGQAHYSDMSLREARYGAGADWSNTARDRLIRDAVTAHGPREAEQRIRDYDHEQALAEHELNHGGDDADRQRDLTITAANSAVAPRTVAGRIRAGIQQRRDAKRRAAYDLVRAQTRLELVGRKEHAQAREEGRPPVETEAYHAANEAVFDAERKVGWWTREQIQQRPPLAERKPIPVAASVDGEEPDSRASAKELGFDEPAASVVDQPSAAGNAAVAGDSTADSIDRAQRALDDIEQQHQADRAADDAHSAQLAQWAADERDTDRRTGRELGPGLGYAF